MYLCIDFETKDPYIARGLGAGWVYKLKVPTSDFQILGAALLMFTDEGIIDDNSTYFTMQPKLGVTLPDLIQKCISHADQGIIMHNAPYDLGCLEVLGIDTSRLIVYDTKIMGILHDNNLFSHSLQSLSEMFLQKDQQKIKKSLGQAAIDKGLVLPPKIKKGIPLTEKQIEAFHKKADKFTISNMDIMQEECPAEVALYAEYDVIATAHMFNVFKNTVGLEDSLKWSSYQNILVQLRKKGNALDVDKIHSAMRKLEPIIGDLKASLETELSIEINSPKQLSEALTIRGYKLPETDKGAASTGKKGLEELAGDPLIDNILKYRNINKLYNDFLKGLLESLEHTDPEAFFGNKKIGMIYPELNLFGAKATGRFSMSSPNLQQIPKAKNEYSGLIREIFVLPEGTDSKMWISADWRNQEGRLQVCDAKLLKLNGADHMVKRFQENPLLDLHQEAADLAGITRSQAKPINLGISYGMQSGSLAKALKLPTKWIVTNNGWDMEVAGAAAEQILTAYHRGMPYILGLINACKKSCDSKGHIKTVMGRKLQKDPKRPYTAISKRIQGSAADMCLIVLKQAYERGLDIQIIVHDEFNIVGTLQDAQILLLLMENCLQNSPIAFPVELKIGDSWGNLKEI